jgi:hypothetical protein
METSTKIMLLTAMYGLPLCFAIFYRIKENILQKRKVAKGNEFIPSGTD